MREKLEMQTIYIPLAILLLDYFIPYYKKKILYRSTEILITSASIIARDFICRVYTYGSGRVRSVAVR